jgi:hypothetical protein
VCSQKKETTPTLRPPLLWKPVHLCHLPSRVSIEESRRAQQRLFDNVRRKDDTDEVLSSAANLLAFITGVKRREQDLSPSVSSSTGYVETAAS